MVDSAVPAAPARALDVVAVGNAIVDVLCTVEDELLQRHGLIKGTMGLVDADAARRLYSAMGPVVEVSGGAAANTAAGVVSLGGQAAFVGKVADDRLGQVFASDLRAAGVAFTTMAGIGGPPTAHCLIMVTPDAERTMSTHLGVAGMVTAADVEGAPLADAACVYLEGYLCGLPGTGDALRLAVDRTHRAGGQVALSLSDPMWVESHRGDLSALLGSTDVVFGNEAEATSLCQVAELDQALAKLAEEVAVVVVTRGGRGSVVVADGRRVDVPAHPVDRVVDTTGAGDLFAAGFLLAHVRGAGAEAAARLGSLAAGEVITHLGARPQTPLSELAAAAGLL